MSLSGFKYSGYLQLLDEKPITAFLNGLYLCNELFASSRNTKVVKLYFQGFKMKRIFLMGCLIFSIAVSTTENA